MPVFEVKLVKAGEAFRAPYGGEPNVEVIEAPIVVSIPNTKKNATELFEAMLRGDAIGVEITNIGPVDYAGRTRTFVMQVKEVHFDSDVIRIEGKLELRRKVLWGDEDD